MTRLKKCSNSLEDIKRGMPLNVHINKFAVLKASADIDKKVGQQPLIGLWMLFSFENLRKEMLCTEPVEKGEWLTVAITSDRQAEPS